MAKKDPLKEFKRIRTWPKNVPMPPASAFHGTEPWTDEDDQAMIKYYQLYGNQYLMRLLGRSERAIVGRAWELRITRPRRVEWTPVEDNYMRKHYATVTAKALGSELGRTEQAVRQRARTLGLTTQVSTPWSDREIAYLRKHYGRTIRCAEIAATLGRTTDAIELKAKRIGVAKHVSPPLTKKARQQVIARLGTDAYTDLAEEFDTTVHIITSIATNHGYRDRPLSRAWTTADEAQLRKLWGTMSRVEVAKRLNRGMPGVAMRATRLGLTRPMNRQPMKYWTHKEEARLRILARTHTIAEIAAKLGRTRESTYGKLQTLGVHAVGRRRRK